ncbi:MAG TPA: hypothetical protein VGO16_18000 [Pseudonocardiaceae bacterium]|nr:hypothetical protein [Pseudonocardiaceae bacterium]
MLTVVPESPAQDDRAAGGSPMSASLVDEFMREGARWMLAEALQREVDEPVQTRAHEVGGDPDVAHAMDMP